MGNAHMGRIMSLMTVDSTIREVVADARGRFTLGAAFAMGRYLAQILPDGEIRLVPAALIPAYELEVLRDPKQLGPLLEGLQAFRNGDYGPSPEIDAWLDEVDLEEVLEESEREAE